MFLKNSNGMDVKLERDESGRNALEYNVIGGVLDFYFFSGPGPKEVARQYAEVVGTPAMVPYWSLGVSDGLVGAGVSLANRISSTSASTGIETGSRWQR